MIRERAISFLDSIQSSIAMKYVTTRFTSSSNTTNCHICIVAFQDAIISVQRHMPSSSFLNCTFTYIQKVFLSPTHKIVHIPNPRHLKLPINFLSNEYWNLLFIVTKQSVYLECDTVCPSDQEDKYSLHLLFFSQQGHVPPFIELPNGHVAPFQKRYKLHIGNKKVLKSPGHRHTC